MRRYEIEEYVGYSWVQDPTEDCVRGRDPCRTWTEAVREAADLGEDARVRIEQDRSILRINRSDPEGVSEAGESDRKRFVHGSIPARQWLDQEKKKEEDDE